ncbi:hypothetical protein MTO96_014386 [Rhipicephalus appendiculatus]
MNPEWARLIEIFKRLDATTVALLEVTGVPTGGLWPTGQLGTPAPGDDQRAEDENHNSDPWGDFMPAKTAEDAQNAEGATEAEDVCDEAAPGDDEAAPGVDEGAENVSGEDNAEVDEECVEDEAGDSQDGEEEAGESQQCDKQVGESQYGDEEAGEFRDGEEDVVEKDGEEEIAGGEDGAGKWKAAADGDVDDKDETAPGKGVSGENHGDTERDPKDDDEKDGGEEEKEANEANEAGSEKDACVDGGELASTVSFRAKGGWTCREEPLPRTHRILDAASFPSFVPGGSCPVCELRGQMGSSRARCRFRTS